MKTSKHELDDNIKILIQDLRMLKLFNIDEYNIVLNDMRKDLGDEFFYKYFGDLINGK